MSRSRTPRKLQTLPLVCLLLAMSLPATIATAQPADPEAEYSPCTGSTTVSYTDDPCGPSLSLPAWNDASGWDDPSYAGTIQLIDLDGDGTDELVGLSQHGLQVNKWSSDWGQWVPASDPNHPLPFGHGSIHPETVRYGMLAEAQAGAVALASDNSGLQAWYWNSGDGSPASGYWTQVGHSGPFANGFADTDWMSSPAYYSTIQFLPAASDAPSYGVAGRAKGGMAVCNWHSNDWHCVTSDAFSNADLTDSEHVGPADYYYETIQFADVYSGSAGAELIGRERVGGGALRVYTWNGSSLAFLDVAGDVPYDSEWNNISYAATIQPAQFAPGAATEQVVGRTSANSLEWWGIKESGCSGASPCWQNLTISPRTQFFTDSEGYQHAEYYSTIQVADIDGDGYVEALGRDPQDGFKTYLLGSRADRWSNTVSGPKLTSGPHVDPLWADPSYYNTIQTGDIDGDGDDELVARGKYGIRTWAWMGTSKGWQRPLDYGFPRFADAQQGAAFSLLNSYLAIADGNTIRDSYTSINTEVMTNYQDCLADSIASGATMPPTSTCELVGPEQQLANQRRVSAADWKSIVETIQQEIAMARAVDGHFNQSMRAILSDLYVLNQADFDHIVETLFPGGGPGPSTNILAVFQDLFFGFVKGLISLVPFGIGGAVGNTMSGIISAVGEIQVGGTTSTAVRDLQTKIAETAGHAITQSNAFFEYVSQDEGLLYLYGTLINDQVWEIQQHQHDTAIATGEFTTAKWIYQTLLPHKWGIWVCGDGVGDVAACFTLIEHPHIGENAIHIPTDHTYTAFLSEQVHAPVAVSTGNHLYKKLFDPMQSDCPLTASSEGAWHYDGCNLGLNFNDLLHYADGWKLRCMVAVNIQENDYECPGGHELPPHGYPPGH